MIEVVSPARTLRFKGETTAEHRLWSDSLHKLCNPPKALSKVSIEEEKQRKLETEAEEARALAKQRVQDRDRIADPKRTKEFSEAIAVATGSATVRGGAEKKHLEQKQKCDEQPEEERSKERSRQHQQQPSDARGDRRAETESRGRNASPPRHRRELSDSRSRRSRSRSNSGSDDNRCERKKRSGVQDDDDTSEDEDDDDGPRSRAQATARQSVKNERNADVASPRERSQAEHEASTVCSRRESSGDERERRRSPPRSSRRRSTSSNDDEDHDPRGKRSTREPSDQEPTRNESEHDQCSDDDDSDDDGIRGESAPAPAAAAGDTVRRVSLLVSQIKSASPRVTSTADPKAKRGASPVSPVAVQLASTQPNAKRTVKEEHEDHDDSSDSDEDPQEESPREPTPRAARESPIKLQSSKEKTHSEHDDDENESKDADEEEKSRTTLPSVQPKKKQETEYFDDDDEEDDDDADSNRGAKPNSAIKPGAGAGRAVNNSNQAALTAHEADSRQERLKSGGNGAIARDNNFVEEDWDAEDEQEAQAPVGKSAGDAVENPAKVRTQAHPPPLGVCPSCARSSVSPRITRVLASGERGFWRCRGRLKLCF